MTGRDSPGPAAPPAPAFPARGAAPLAWVRAQPGPPAYVNVGDALSPFLVSMVSGRPTVPAAFRGTGARMAAIGTIGQNLAGGEVWVWGSGCSPWRDPVSPGRAPYAPPPDTILHLTATRGPMSAALLSGGRAPDLPFGDPAMLLPLFYDPPRAPRWELGVVLHLSELADRSFGARPRPGLARYDAPARGVRLITMVAPPTIAGVRGKIDEILACRRIVSTSLHGYAIAAAYGLPSLYMGGDPGPDGLARAGLDGAEAERVNARFVDLLLGCGAREIVYWRQRRTAATDWEALMRATDAEARPLRIDAEALMAACPAGRAALTPRPGESIWDAPALRSATPAPRPAPRGVLARAVARLTGGRASGGRPPGARR